VGGFRFERSFIPGPCIFLHTVIGEQLLKVAQLTILAGGPESLRCDYSNHTPTGKMVSAPTSRDRDPTSAPDVPIDAFLRQSLAYLTGPDVV
jgi:hypothetical protein